MRFRSRRQPVPYLNRRDQLRMLAMLGLLMLVVIGMRWAARPSSWYWLTGVPPRTGRPTAERGTSPLLDFSVKDAGSDRALRPDEFIVLPPAGVHDAGVANASDDAVGRNASLAEARDRSRGRNASAGVAASHDGTAAKSRKQSDSGETPEAGRSSSDVHEGGGSASKDANGAGSGPPEGESGTPVGNGGGDAEQSAALPQGLGPDLRIPRELLADVEDRTLGVLKKEKRAHDWILSAVRKVPPEALEKAARRDVGFVALMTHPEDFRGELIRVDGVLGRVARFGPGPNDFGLKQLYEAYILTHESPENPIRFVCTEVPRELLPPQQGLREFDRDPPRVTAVGYFFKLYGYRARKGPHVAPLVLGARLVWHRPRPVEQVASSAMYWFLGFVAAILAVLGVVMWQFHRSDRQFQQTHLKRFQEPPEMFTQQPDVTTAVESVESSDRPGSATHDAAKPPSAGPSSAEGGPVQKTDDEAGSSESVSGEDSAQ
ncbi:MAG: hypothetical protein D6725_09020 [Planctomycetota bacterium]|nr:MAG: hypothetical protein D6725_09020 [Planctomycetota bacterium]